jgi:peptide/nickel transport system permease protein
MDVRLSRALPVPARRRRRIRPAGVWGLLLVLLVASSALVGPVLHRASPNRVNLALRLAPPSAAMPLGADHMGRDMLARLLIGGRYSLGAAAGVTAVSMALGTAIGLLAAMAGRWVDELLMRTIDVLLAFPSIVLALVVVGLMGPNLRNLLLALAGVRWAVYARLARSGALQVRETEYVNAARSVGVPTGRLVWRYLLPNMAGPLVVFASVDVGRVLLAISGLSFIGLGVQLPIPEWGAMLNEGRKLMHVAPRLALLPGLAIAVSVLGLNLLGEALSARWDVTSSR